MLKLCERPGCSEPGAAAYGMVPEDLLFWIAPLGQEPAPTPRVLCLRHADAMVVPLGWTLDDRREDTPRLFKPRPPVERPDTPPRQRRKRSSADDRPEQLQIDGTGEIERPLPVEPNSSVADAAWRAEFDANDDLDGVLEVSSPLLARAFRGVDRPRR